MSDCIIIQGSLTLYDGDVVRITHVDDIASGSVGSMSVSCEGHNGPGGYVYGEQSLPAWTGGDGAVVSYQIKIVNVGGPGCEGEISVEGRGDVQTRVITEPKIYYEARLAGRTPAVVSCDGGTETASCLLFKVTEWRDTNGGVQTDLESTGVTGSVSHTFSKNTGLAVSCPETTTLSAPDGTSVNFTYTFRQEAVNTEVTISDVTADKDGNIGARDGIVVKKGDIADPPTNVGANWGGKLAYKTRNVYCLYTGKCLGFQRVWVPPKMSGGGGNGKPSVTPGGDSGGNGGGGSGGGGNGGTDTGGIVDDGGDSGGGGDDSGGGEDPNAFRVVPVRASVGAEETGFSVAFVNGPPSACYADAGVSATLGGQISFSANTGGERAFSAYWEKRNASGALETGSCTVWQSAAAGGGDSGEGDGSESGGESGGGSGDSGGGGNVTPPPEPGAFIWVNPPRLVFPLAGGVLRVVVSSSSTWEAISGHKEIAFSTSADGEFTPYSLKGLPAGEDVELFVRCDAMRSGGEAPLVFRNEEGRGRVVELRVEDEPSDPGEDIFPVISVSPAYLSGADAQARSWSVRVYSNRDFALDPASVPEWLSVETAGGAPAAEAATLSEADCPLRVRAAANASLEARAAQLAFKTIPTEAHTAVATARLSVAQAGAAANALLSEAATVAAAGGGFALRGYARDGWEWSVAPRDALTFPEWLAPAASEAAGTGASAEFACAFAVAANTGAEARECVLLVSFADAESGAAETFEFTVSQAAEALPPAEPATLSLLEPAGGTLPALHRNGGGARVRVVARGNTLPPAVSVAATTGKGVLDDLVFEPAPAEPYGEEAGATLYAWHVGLAANATGAVRSALLEIALDAADGGARVRVALTQLPRLPRILPRADLFLGARRASALL